MKLAFNKAREGKRDATMRFGLVSLLMVREWSYYLVTQYTCLMLGFVILGFPETPAQLIKLIFFQYPLSEWFFIIR
jgi:hypothetical protein